MFAFSLAYLLLIFRCCWPTVRRRRAVMAADPAGRSPAHEPGAQPGAADRAAGAGGAVLRDRHRADGRWLRCAASRRNGTTVALLRRWSPAWWACASPRCRSTGCFVPRPGMAARPSAPWPRRQDIAVRYRALRRRDRARPRLGLRPLLREVRVHPGQQSRCSSALSTALARDHRLGDVQRDADQDRHLFRQAAVLLLYQADLAPGESKDMGVVFFVDPDILNDPNTRDVERSRCPIRCSGPPSPPRQPGR